MRKAIIVISITLTILSVSGFLIFARANRVNIAIIDSYLENPNMYDIEKVKSFSNKENVGIASHGEVVLSIVLQNCKDANIYYAQLLDENLGATNEETARAIRWCAEQKVDIICMSFAGKDDDICLREAIEYAKSKGIVLVASCINRSPEICYPAMYDGVISVSDGGNNSAKYILENKRIKYEYNGRKYNITSSSYYTAYIAAKIAHDM